MLKLRPIFIPVYCLLLFAGIFFAPSHTNSQVISDTELQTTTEKPTTPTLVEHLLVVERLPAPDTVADSINSWAVRIRFSEPLLPQTVDNNTFQVKEKISGNPLNGVIEVNNDRVIFYFESSLALGREYNVLLKSTISSSDGTIELGKDYSWDFRTAEEPPPPDTTPPTVVKQSPSSGSTTVSPIGSVQVIYNENLNPKNVRISVVNANGNVIYGMTSVIGKTLRFLPTNPFSFGTRFTVTVRWSGLSRPFFNYF